MYYGINTMGSYASQMTEEEMWMVDHYVMSLKDKLDGKDARPYDVVEVVTEVEEMHMEDSHDQEGEHGTEEDHNVEDNHGAEH